MAHERASQRNGKVDEVVAFCFLYNGGGTENVKKIRHLQFVVYIMFLYKYISPSIKNGKLLGITHR